jgi:riboflavin biosynthesis pyrimidine reductase
MLERGLADELVIYVAPKIVGGPAKSWVGGKGLASLTGAHKFVFDGDPVNLAGDLRITAVPDHSDRDRALSLRQLTIR